MCVGGTGWTSGRPSLSASLIRTHSSVVVCAMCFRDIKIVLSLEVGRGWMVSRLGVLSKQVRFADSG